MSVNDESPVPPLTPHPPKDINLSKYVKLPGAEIYFDPRPRIRNIVRELEQDHDWVWPPRPPPDFEKKRLLKRRKWSWLYGKECLDLCSILAMIIGPWELLVAFGFCILPKTFVPALRESSEFCVIFVGIYLFQGFKHVFVSILGLSLRSMCPWLVGFVHISWTYGMIWPLLGIFVSAVGFYTAQEWRVEQEMEQHLMSYGNHWFSKSGWDSYQSYMKCCGIREYSDWQKIGASLEEGDLLPGSCCWGGSCTKDATILASQVYSWGCLEVTIKSMQILFASGTICMIVGIFLEVMGYLSVREAEGCVGDPIHTLLFDTSDSLNVSKNRNRASRREELLSLLDHYCLLVGEEMCLDKEVKDAREEMQIPTEVIQLPVKKEQEVESSQEPKKEEKRDSLEAVLLVPVVIEAEKVLEKVAEVKKEVEKVVKPLNTNPFEEEDISNIPEIKVVEDKPPKEKTAEDKPPLQEKIEDKPPVKIVVEDKSQEKVAQDKPSPLQEKVVKEETSKEKVEDKHSLEKVSEDKPSENKPPIEEKFDDKPPLEKTPEDKPSKEKDEIKPEEIKESKSKISNKSPTKSIPDKDKDSDDQPSSSLSRDSAQK